MPVGGQALITPGIHFFVKIGTFGASTLALINGGVFLVYMKKSVDFTCHGRSGPVCCDIYSSGLPTQWESRRSSKYLPEPFESVWRPSDNV